MDARSRAHGEPENLLNIREAAERLGLAPKTLYGWVAAAKIPYVKIGGALRFRPADLEKFVSDRSYVPPPNR